MPQFATDPSADEGKPQSSNLRVAWAANDPQRVRYTIATLVNDMAQYDEMRESFIDGGFGATDCEYLIVDNTSPPQTCAYRGLNAALAAARGDYVILCHQDVRLMEDDRTSLDDRLHELTLRDPDWALAGNAGGIANGRLAIRITDPHGDDQQTEKLPAKVMSLDENFIVVRNDARIGFSRDLTGFHFYGADICLNADIAGWNAYVIDFHLRHLSGGNKNETFDTAQSAFRAKWANALRPRWMQTTCALLRLTNSPAASYVSQIMERPLASLYRRRGSKSCEPSVRRATSDEVKAKVPGDRTSGDSAPSQKPASQEVA